MDAHNHQQPAQNVASSSSSSNDAKRQAMTGQWRTPPLPVFAAPEPHPHQQHQQQQQQQQQSAIAMPPPPSLPESTDDYAKALQEAYRRGAEAAAALQMQQHQQPHPPIPPAAAQQHDFSPPHPHSSISNAVSCPNFHQLQPSQQQQMAAAATTQSHPHQQQQQPAQQQHHHMISVPTLHTHGSAPDATMSSSPSPSPVAAFAQQPPQQPPQLQQPQQQPPPPPHAALLVPNPLHHPAAAAAAAGAASTATASPPPPHNAAPRSFSLPDMASYAARAQAEEEKRKKRLARNRASARLRRLRKKNLVDSYEGEVGVLEQSLQKLQAHEWGELDASQDATSALMEALGMERGQQVLEDNQQRIALLKELWQQQRDQVHYVRDCQLEQQILKALVDNSDPQQQQQDEDATLLQELSEVLQLTPEQQDSLRLATEGLEEDVQAMEAVDACLQAMQDQDWWLQNEGVTQIANQFTSILHSNQIAKFLLWTDANAEAMEQLDFIHASNGPVASSPVFSFGMDDYYPTVSSSSVNHGGGSTGSLTPVAAGEED